MEETVVIVTPCDRGWGAVVILGVISLLFGFLMMLFPKTTAVAVMTLIGVLVIILGVIMLLASLLMPAGAFRSTLMLLGGIAGILVGVGIIVYPILAGSILTEIIGAAIIIIGMMQMLFGLIYEGDSRRTLYFIAGLLSVIFALLILSPARRERALRIPRRDIFHHTGDLNGNCRVSQPLYLHPVC